MKSIINEKEFFFFKIENNIMMVQVNERKKMMERDGMVRVER